MGCCGGGGASKLVSVVHSSLNHVRPGKEKEKWEIKEMGSNEEQVGQEARADIQGKMKKK